MAYRAIRKTCCRAASQGTGESKSHVDKGLGRPRPPNCRAHSTRGWQCSAEVSKVKFTHIANIWTVDASRLSNLHRGIIYFERAKIVVARALSDASERKLASRGTRFNRRYLAAKIGSAYSVMQQNRDIKLLLKTADARLAELSSGQLLLARKASINDRQRQNSFD